MNKVFYLGLLFISYIIYSLHLSLSDSLVLLIPAVTVYEFLVDKVFKEV